MDLSNLTCTTNALVHSHHTFKLTTKCKRFWNYHGIAAVAGQDNDINGRRVVGHTDSSIFGFIFTARIRTSQLHYLVLILCLRDKATHGEYVKSLTPPRTCKAWKHRASIPSIELRTEIESARVFPALKKPTAHNRPTAFSLHFSPVYDFHFYLLCKIVYIKKLYIFLPPAACERSPFPQRFCVLMF